MLKNLFHKVVGDPNSKELARLQPVVDEINALEPEFHHMPDVELRAVTDECRARRTVGLRHFDVQLMGGMVLHKNKIAEMKTGEGKTLVATLPLYLNALLGHGAHLVTPNDYLSKFGAQTMGPVYHALGLGVGGIQHETAIRFGPHFKNEDDPLQRVRLLRR